MQFHEPKCGSGHVCRVIAWTRQQGLVLYMEYESIRRPLILFRRSSIAFDLDLEPQSYHFKQVRLIFKIADWEYHTWKLSRFASWQVREMHEWWLFNSYIFLTLEIHYIERQWLIGLEGRVFDNGPGNLGSIPGHVIPKTLK